MNDDRTIIVRNDASEAVPPWGIMRITGADKDDAGQLFLKVDKPNSSFQTWHLVNGPFEIPKDKYGIAQPEGFAYAAYDTGNTPAFDQYWGAKDGEWKLFKNRDGFQILGLPNDGHVLIKQHKVTQLIGKLSGSLSAGSTQSATIWVGAGGSESASAYSVTLQDWMIPSGKSIASGSKVVAMLMNGVWYLIAASACAK